MERNEDLTPLLDSRTYWHKPSLDGYNYGKKHGPRTLFRYDRPIRYNYNQYNPSRGFTKEATNTQQEIKQKSDNISKDNEEPSGNQPATTTEQPSQMQAWITTAIIALRLMAQQLPAALRKLLSATISQTWLAVQSFFVWWIITSLINKTEASGRKGKFVYQSHGKILASPDYIWSIIEWLPCDFEHLEERMQQALSFHERLCKKPFETPLTTKDHIQEIDKEGNFVVLKATYTRNTARSLCQSLGPGGGLAEVRSEKDKLSLQRLMGKHLFQYVFAGIDFDVPTQEYVFHSSGNMAKSSMFPTIAKRHDSYDQEPITWEEAGKAYPNFLTYTIEDNILKLNIEEEMSYYDELKRADPGKSMTCHVICKKPATTETQETTRWRKSCHNNQRHMSQAVAKASEEIKEILPKHWPEKMKPTPDLFRHLNNPLDSNNRRKRDTEEEIRKIITKKTQNLSARCQAYLENNHINKPITNDDGPKKRHKRWVHLIPIAVGLFAMAASAAELIKELHLIEESRRRLAATAKPKYAYGGPSNEIKTLLQEQQWQDHAIEFAVASYLDQQLVMLVQRTAKYVAVTHAAISPCVYSGKDVELTKFISRDDRQKMKQEMSSSYGVQIPASLRMDKTYLTTNGISVFLVIASPVVNMQSEAELYSVTALPVYDPQSPETRLWPAIQQHYFAHHYENNLRFTPLAISEFLLCKKQRACTTAMTTKDDTTKECGISEFYDQDGDCKYTEEKQGGPYFITEDKWTYYAQRANTTTTLKLECSNSRNRGLKRQSITLTDPYGKFRLKRNCVARKDGQTMKPSFRSFIEDPPENEKDAITIATGEDTETDQNLARIWNRITHFQLTKPMTTMKILIISISAVLAILIVLIPVSLRLCPNLIILMCTKYKVHEVMRLIKKRKKDKEEEEVDEKIELNPQEDRLALQQAPSPKEAQRIGRHPRIQTLTRGQENELIYDVPQPMQISEFRQAQYQ